MTGESMHVSQEVPGGMTPPLEGFALGDIALHLGGGREGTRRTPRMDLPSLLVP